MSAVRSTVSVNHFADPGPVRLEVKDLRIQLTSTGADVVGDVSFSVTPGRCSVSSASPARARRPWLSLSSATLAGVSISRRARFASTARTCSQLKAGELRELRGAKVAYVPQDPSAALDPTLRIGIQLREALSVHPGTVGDVDSARHRGAARGEARLHARDC